MRFLALHKLLGGQLTKQNMSTEGSLFLQLKCGVACQQGTLTPPDAWFRPLFGACIDSDCWDHFFLLYTDFMTVPYLTLTELREVSMEHLRRVWHAGSAYPFGHLVPSLLLGTCLCSNCWDQITRTCHAFTRLLTLNNQWYFLDFALNLLCVKFSNNCINFKVPMYE